MQHPMYQITYKIIAREILNTDLVWSYVEGQQACQKFGDPNVYCLEM